eukprot:83036_1
MDIVSKPEYIRFVHIPVYITLIASILPAFHLLNKTICLFTCCSIAPRLNINVTRQQSESTESPTSPPAESDQENDIILSNKLKFFIFVSIICSILYVMCTSYQTTIMFLPHEDTRLYYSQCVSLGGLRVLFYTFGRVFLYFFFLLRTHETFRDSAFGFKKITLRLMFLFPMSAIFLSILPLCYLQGNQMKWYVLPDTSGGGTYCVSEPKSKSIENLYKIVLIYSCVIDIMNAYFCIHLLVSKLFKMIYASMETKNVSPTTNTSISMADVKYFHGQTNSHNRLIKMMSKLIILLTIAVISSQITVIMAVVVPDFLYMWYSMDCCINLYILWLNFNFTDKYYRKYFCGNKCIRCCFPLVKTMAISCNDECNGNNDHSLCKEIFCCFWYGCKHCLCDQTNRNEQMKVYIMAKAEIELVVNA